MEFFRKLRDKAAWAALQAIAREVLVSLGLSRLIMAIVIGFAGLIWAWIEDLPTPIIALAGLGSVVLVLALMLLTFLLYDRIRGRPIDPLAELKIGELFVYLCPILLGENADILDPESKSWLKVGIEVRDKASVGALTICGREYDKLWDDFFGSVPLTKVPRDYWEKGDFTYRWFGEQKNDPLHTYHPGFNGPVYRDLRVGKSQVMSIWPPTG